VSEKLYTEWVRRTHRLMPWTVQELAVKELLFDLGLPFDPRHVFELPDDTRLSIDFLIFVGPGIALECTSCTKRRGSAIAEVRRRSAFLDYRFSLLRKILPNLRCAALVEAPNEDRQRVVQAVRGILGSWSLAATSLESLRTGLSVLVRS